MATRKKKAKAKAKPTKKRGTANKKKKGTTRARAKVSRSKVVKSRHKEKKRSAPKKTYAKVMPSRRTLKRLDEIKRAKLTLNVKKNRSVLEETRWLTPTKRGFNAVDRMNAAIYKHSKRKAGQSGLELYSYQLFVTFTGPDGKPVSSQTGVIGIPMPNRIKDKKGLTKQERFTESIRDNIRRKIYHLLSEKFDVVSPGKHVKAGVMTEKQAARMMKKIRSGRNTRFKLVVYRQGV